jgi:hypothetical protein
MMSPSESNLQPKPLKSVRKSSSCKSGTQRDNKILDQSPGLIIEVPLEPYSFTILQGILIVYGRRETFEHLKEWL